MKCPYNRHSETHVQGWTQKYDENQQPVSSVSADKYQFELMDCLKEECGAYRDGMCCFASSGFQ